jgi:hypothetical protein
VVEVRRAIHVRTGQRAAVDAVDAWLKRHDTEVVSFDDVYAACVHLLQAYERVPDLALIGSDWLGEDEYNIVTYMRQTWPRVGIVVYGESRSTPVFDMLPMTQSCRMEDALRRLIAEPPAVLLEQLRTRASELAATPATTTQPADLRREDPSAPAASREAPRDNGQRRSEQPGQEATKPVHREARAAEFQRSPLTAEELSALLDGIDED